MAWASRTPCVPGTFPCLLGPWCETRARTSLVSAVLRVVVQISPVYLGDLPARLLARGISSLAQLETRTHMEYVSAGAWKSDLS